MSHQVKYINIKSREMGSKSLGICMPQWETWLNSVIDFWVDMNNSLIQIRDLKAPENKDTQWVGFSKTKSEAEAAECGMKRARIQYIHT